MRGRWAEDKLKEFTTNLWLNQIDTTGLNLNYWIWWTRGHLTSDNSFECSHLFFNYVCFYGVIIIVSWHILIWLMNRVNKWVASWRCQGALAPFEKFLHHFETMSRFSSENVIKSELKGEGLGAYYLIFEKNVENFPTISHHMHHECTKSGQ